MMSKTLILQGNSQLIEREKWGVNESLNKTQAQRRHMTVYG